MGSGSIDKKSNGSRPWRRFSFARILAAEERPVPYKTWPYHLRPTSLCPIIFEVSLDSWIEDDPLTASRNFFDKAEICSKELERGRQISCLRCFSSAHARSEPCSEYPQFRIISPSSYIPIPSIRSFIDHCASSAPFECFGCHAFECASCNCVNMAPKFKDGDVVVSFNGKWISWTHTVIAYSTEASEYHYLWHFADQNCSCIYQCPYCRDSTPLP